MRRGEREEERSAVVELMTAATRGSAQHGDRVWDSDSDWDWDVRECASERCDEDVNVEARREMWRRPTRREDYVCAERR